MPESTTHLEDQNIGNQAPLSQFLSCLFYTPLLHDSSSLSLVLTVLYSETFSIHVHTCRIHCLVGPFASSYTGIHGCIIDSPAKSGFPTCLTLLLWENMYLEKGNPTPEPSTPPPVPAVSANTALALCPMLGIFILVSAGHHVASGMYQRKKPGERFPSPRVTRYVLVPGQHNQLPSSSLGQDPSLTVSPESGLSLCGFVELAQHSTVLLATGKCSVKGSSASPPHPSPPLSLSASSILFATGSLMSCELLVIFFSLLPRNSAGIADRALCRFQASGPRS